MEQYIPKAALVAEIEKLILNGKLKCQQSQENNDQVSYIAWSEHIATCGKILSFINTLEVKEVDLEEEVKRWKNEHGVYGMDDLDYIFAKHFYELGLRTHIPAIYKPTETDVYKLGLKAHKG